ncbi:UDP-N-acetylglucosamine 2-epimerase (non-hydrolysing)/UDP-GlcNAc3NAcA epimerase [Alkalibaculum bacchi]|uniref:UDP-N-acetylglucosamine 2-epimerase (Non-hydrolysing)/UDP-GlcNAc3NAcA epimerase n=1 Tax=Alkalibaculum bacchi TaxID=645887 RepID=A0A366IDM7_9FIRM|nr:UDP-N-acetylglucosamine 2-epimerase (non-hydrolyzing) [Alkalibaculum bacchi]RBP69094.1 UDP-N-acetylglucosamine 2-epimerase (non-hydrolysing)/UDP-GlcNAc3NAcA epimerase [Alkalibaculum bacchi]
MNLLTIIGARPQFIKAAPFSEEFRKNNIEILVHTGQHYDANMSDVFFEELGIPKPDYNLGVGSGSHGKQTAKMLEGIEKIILNEKPDGLLVYGDTNSTLAGALAASKLHIPVYHVEAGLRSYNKLMPEEQNRILTDHISNILFCPTQTAVNNLSKEGITSGVINSGDIMFDAVLRNINISNEKYANGAWFDELIRDNGTLPKLNDKEYYLATIHRAENTDNPEKLFSIFKAFSELDKPVLIPLHPRTKKLIKDLNINFKNIVIIKPVGYLLMLYLTSNAYMVVTDSGGLQKEAYFLKTPCTTLRDQTEWVETLADEWNVLSHIDIEEIKIKAQRELACLQQSQPNSFGDGNATAKICEAIINGGQQNE